MSSFLTFVCWQVCCGDEDDTDDEDVDVFNDDGDVGDEDGDDDDENDNDDADVTLITSLSPHKKTNTNSVIEFFHTLFFTFFYLIRYTTHK